MKYDVVSLGELLIDFTESGVSQQGNRILEANPGGAPCNVLSMLQNLGRNTAFIGKVGNDQLGKYLKQTIEERNISSEYLYLDNNIHTTLAFVHNNENGEREFSFFRNPGADMMLDESEIPDKLFKDTAIFHFGTLSLTDEPVRSATLKALKYAKKEKNLISFDPNYRPLLWKSASEAKTQIMVGLTYCDIVKMSDDELYFTTGIENVTEAVIYLKRNYNIKLILITMGSKGSMAFYDNIIAKHNGFKTINTVDTTGAGDTFCGCALHKVLEYGINNICEENLNELLEFSNAAASIITTRKGALRVEPSLSEIQQLLSKNI